MPTEEVSNRIDNILSEATGCSEKHLDSFNRTLFITVDTRFASPIMREVEFSILWQHISCKLNKDKTVLSFSTPARSWHSATMPDVSKAETVLPRGTIVACLFDDPILSHSEFAEAIVNDKCVGNNSVYVRGPYAVIPPEGIYSDDAVTDIKNSISSINEYLGEEDIFYLAPDNSIQSKYIRVLNEYLKKSGIKLTKESSKANSVNSAPIPERLDASIGSIPTSTKDTYLTKLKSRGRDKKLDKIIDDGFYVSKDKFWFIVRCAKRNIPVLLTGPTGVGKTTLAYYVADFLDKNFVDIPMGNMQDPVSGLLGVHRLQDGRSYFQMAPFAENSMKKNTVILLDEINRVPPSASNILFPALDHRRKIPLDLMDDEDMRDNPVGRGTSYIATANIGFKYSGTNSVDEALRERFTTVELDYPDKVQEASMLRAKFPEADEALTDRVVNYIHTVRDYCIKEELNFVPSPRTTIHFMHTIVDGFRMKLAIEVHIISRLDEESAEAIKNFTI